MANACAGLARCWRKQACQISDGAIGPNQALKMVWSFSEINPFAHTAGSLPFALDREAYCIRELAKIRNPSTVTHGNAEKLFYDDETFCRTT